jgi:hypothetical protein
MEVLMTDDTSVNSNLADPDGDEEGPPWDCDLDYPITNGDEGDEENE